MNKPPLYNLQEEYYKNKEVHYAPKEAVIDKVLGMVKPQDLIITLGAGDIARLSDELAERFKSKA